MIDPKISVVTVCFNARETIEKTILSVISQTYRNIEYLVIDGGSTDGTADIISRYADRIDYFVSEPDKGIYDAMNKGIAAASGDWITFRNSGDCFVSEETVDRLFSAPVGDNVTVIHGDCIYTNDWGYKYEKPGILYRSFKEGMPVLHPATFVRLDYHKDHLFDTAYRCSGDYQFFYECCKDLVVFEYRPLPIATFESGGYASVNLRRTYEEDCRIKGLKVKQAKCALISAKTLILGWVAESKLLRRLYRAWLIRKGWKCLPVPSCLS